MIDLHAHLLPGVDDGAASLEEAVAMHADARADGTVAMVITPHQRHPRWPNESSERLAEQLAALGAAAGAALRLALGAEVYVDSGLLDEVEKGRVLPLAGSKYLLLEFPPQAVPTARDVVHELGVMGWRPILAHPERVAPWAAEPASILRLADAGALVQLTAMSLTGEFGRRAQRCCRFLLDCGCVHFIASDAHDLERRPPRLRRAWEMVVHVWGEEVASLLFRDNPAAVLADRPLG